MALKEKNSSPKITALFIIAFAVVSGVFIGYVMFGTSESRGATSQNPATTTFQFYSTPLVSSGQAVMYLPAVMRNDTGVSAHVIVTAEKGTGKITANLDNVLVADDTQQSIRMAALVAESHEGVKPDTIDLNYDIRADASTLEGPSAGAAFAVATIAAIRNASIRPDAMMTGTINHDGTIGPAGKIFEKAAAAKSAGAKTFLVPLGASRETNYTEGEFCYTWGTYNYCQPEFTPETVDVADIAGINVVEVRNIDDAINFFIDQLP